MDIRPTAEQGSGKVLTAEKSAAAVILAVAVTVFIFNLAPTWPFTMDDSFITFRYARNLAAGHGPVFNPGGPPTEGYTSFLWVIVTAIPHLLGLGAAAFAKAAGVLATLGTAAAVYILALRLAGALENGGRHLLASVAVLFFLAQPYPAIHAISGMETALFTFLLCVLFLCLDRVYTDPSGKNAVLLASACLLAGLTRPEGNLLAIAGSLAVLFLIPRGDRKRLGIRLLLIYVLPGAIYFIWRWAYYGSLLPLPFYIKMFPRTPALGWYVTKNFVWFHLYRSGLFMLCALILLRRRVLPSLSGVILFLIFYTLPSHVMGDFSRFLIPAAPLIAALSAAGIASFFILLRRFVRRIEKWSRTAIAALTILISALIACSLSFNIALFDFRFHVSNNRTKMIKHCRYYSAALERAHIALGKKLALYRARDKTPLLALGDAGAVPYYSNWRTLDTWSLNDPVLAKSKEYDTEYVLSKNPDVLVLVSVKADEFEPGFEWEMELYDGALRKGMEKIFTLHHSASYHLWLMAQPGSDVWKFLRK
ncbi:MAG: hypothetical protein ACYS8W_07815 [Planctomycetota bacterium]|jgi:hypothetical protein